MCLSGTICPVFLPLSSRWVSLHGSQKVRPNPPEPCAKLSRGGAWNTLGGYFVWREGFASQQNQKWFPSQARSYMRWSKRAPSPRALLRSSVGGFGFVSSAFVRLRSVTNGPARCAAKTAAHGAGAQPTGGQPPSPAPTPRQSRPEAARKIRASRPRRARPVGLGRIQARKPCAGAPRLVASPRPSPGRTSRRGNPPRPRGARPSGSPSRLQRAGLAARANPARRPKNKTPVGKPSPHRRPPLIFSGLSPENQKPETALANPRLISSWFSQFPSVKTFSRSISGSKV